jgi:hypothetical protein
MDYWIPAFAGTMTVFEPAHNPHAGSVTPHPLMKIPTDMNILLIRAAGHWLAALCLLIPLAPSAATRADDGARTLQRLADPVIVEGVELPPLSGKDINHIRVFAFHENRPVAIPYQIDQRDSTGCWVWTVVYRQSYQIDSNGGYAPLIRKPENAGSGTVDDQDPKGQALLDDNDELVFMATDLGDRGVDVQRTLHAGLVLQIEVVDAAAGTRGWAYAAWYPDSPPARSETRYMQYNARDRMVRSPLYDFHFSDEHTAVIHDLRVNGTPIIDRIRINGEITLDLPFIDSTIKFTEEDIHGYTEGYIAGPVRIIRRNIAHLELAGGLLSSSEVTCDHFYYPRHAEIPVCLSIRFPVKQVSMTLTTDYRKPPFHHLFMGQAREPAQGQTRSLEAHVRELGTEWIAFDSNNASIISLMVVPSPIEGKASAQPCLCGDTEETARAQASVDTPTEAGFLITSTTECPKGEHVLYGTYLISARPYQPGDENAVLRMQQSKLRPLITPVSAGD